MSFESFSKPAQRTEAANENHPPIEVLRQNVAELKIAIQEFHCPPGSERSLTSEEWESAKELSRQLRTAEDALEAAVDLEAKQRNQFPDPAELPDWYPGKERLVEAAKAA